MNSQSLRIIHLLYSFMQQNCPESCHKLTSRPPEVRHVPDDKEQFYDFKAKTSVGKVLEMENFEGYVTVIVNCARVCGEFIFGLRMDVFKAFVHAVDSMAGYCFHDITCMFCCINHLNNFLLNNINLNHYIHRSHRSLLR